MTSQTARGALCPIFKGAHIFRAAFALVAVLCASASMAVDLAGKYTGRDGVVAIRRTHINGLFAVSIDDKNGQCGMALDMRFAKNRLYSDEFPVSITFTKKGILLDMPREDLGEACAGFGVGSPFKRQ